MNIQLFFEQRKWIPTNLNEFTVFENDRPNRGKDGGKGYTRLAAESDQVYQLLAHGRWLSLGTAACSNITGRHDIAEILLKVALKHTQKSILPEAHK